MMCRPDAPGRILQLSSEPVRVIGIAGLVLLCAYVAFASRRPRVIGIRNWSVVLPGGWATLIQIGIGLADLGCSSLAMYSVMPFAASEEFFTLPGPFLSAPPPGLAPHAP